MDGVRMKRLAGMCDEWVRQDVHKALVVLVARRGVICLHEAYGKLGPHGGPPLERDSIFPMMSITKPITATVLMQLVEDGIVGLTRPVQEYVPEFCGEGKDAVCVHHLLTHTSGLDDVQVIPAGRQRWDSVVLPPVETTQHPWIAQWLAVTADLPLSYAPGEKMVYASCNYALAGEIVRRASGSALSDLAGSRIFRPLGMNDSSYVLPDDLVSRTVGWQIGPLELVDTRTHEFRTTPYADGGVHSTARDIAVFGQTFLNGGAYGNARILRRGTVAEMTRDQIPGVPAVMYSRSVDEASWGYGWGVAGTAKWPNWPAFTRGTIAHSGAGAMMLWVDPAHEIVGVYLSICRYTPPPTFQEITNVDLFVNAVTAAVRD